RIDRDPPLTIDVTWPEACRGESVSPRLLAKPSLDLRLVDTISVDGVRAVGLRRRDRGCISTHPNRTAEQIVFDLPAQRFHKLLRRLKLERNHIDDDVCVERGDARAEFTRCLFGFPVYDYLFDGLPCGMWSVR